MLPHWLRERANGKLQLHFVGDDVVPGSAIDGTHGNDGGIERRNLPRHDCLERHNRLERLTPRSASNHLK